MYQEEQKRQNLKPIFHIICFDKSFFFRINSYLYFRRLGQHQHEAYPQQHVLPRLSFRCCLCTLGCVKDSCVFIYVSSECHAVLKPQEVLCHYRSTSSVVWSVLIQKDWPRALVPATSYKQRTDLDKDKRRSRLDDRGRYCFISPTWNQKDPGW